MPGRSCAPLGKSTAEIHSYNDHRTNVLVATLVSRAPGYTVANFRNSRRIPPRLRSGASQSARCEG
jgi:hypothetical protein